jgi:hypothetical protein
MGCRKVSIFKIKAAATEPMVRLSGQTLLDDSAAIS